jgi:alkanesulfonate monooxygenase SsuD/methylene tetrahydromethanopterin reductase-like flavin-dependent oxidoreductase (luciferase family)
MDVGIIVPNAAPGVAGDVLLDWGRRAEECGFASVGVIGRTVYPSYEELITLGAIAGVTQSVRLLSSVLIAPARETVLLAKQAATLDRLSGGRLILGMGAGMRADDFAATGSRFDNRGDRLDTMLATMHALWRGEPPPEGGRDVCPPPVRGRVPIYFGTLTNSVRTVRRIARWGDGFMAVGSREMVDPIIASLREAWDAESRGGSPRIIGASYFALGDEEEAERNIHAYYDDFLPALGNAAIGAMPRTPKAAKRILEYFRDAGYDEFNFSAAAADPGQVERLADAVL